MNNHGVPPNCLTVLRVCKEIDFFWSRCFMNLPPPPPLSLTMLHVRACNGRSGVLFPF